MRPRKCRLVRSSPMVRFYKPRGVRLVDLHVAVPRNEEWEDLLPVEYKRLGYEAAAKMMGVSRLTFSRILASGRSSIAKTIAEGASLKIDGGYFKLVDGDENRTEQKTTKCLNYEKHCITSSVGTTVIQYCACGVCNESETITTLPWGRPAAFIKNERSSFNKSNTKSVTSFRNVVTTPVSSRFYLHKRITVCHFSRR